MSEFKAGDILVSLKQQKSSDKTDPVTILEGYIGENISPEDPSVVFFKDTPPARGAYKAKDFRLATEDELEQYRKGKKIVEPECPYEEGDIIFVTENVLDVDSEEDMDIRAGLILEVDGIIKTKDPSKSIMYFRGISGYYKVMDSFRKATQEEIDTYNGTVR